MDMAEERVKRARAHQVYKLNGVTVPGVTTVLNVLNKPALVPWANKMGLAGIDTAKYVDALARIGTLAHHRLECHLTGHAPELDDYSPDELDKADNSLLSYFEWAKGHEVVPLLCEWQGVSRMGFGGTVDCYAMIDGVLTLLDFKTGKAIYAEHLYQVAAYRQLLEEAERPVAQVMILQIGRAEDEGFSTRTVSDTTSHFEIFRHCLAIYQLQKIAK